MHINASDTIKWFGSRVCPCYVLVLDFFLSDVAVDWRWVGRLEEKLKIMVVKDQYFSFPHPLSLLPPPSLSLSLSLPWGVAIIGLMYLRKKNPPMKELIVSASAVGNFSMTSDLVALQSHLMPKGTSSMLSFSWWRMERTNSWRIGTCSLICCCTFGLASAWRGREGERKSLEISISSEGC